jgi:hypothetical protein
MGAFKDFFTWLQKPFVAGWTRFNIDAIEGAQSVDVLDSFWNQLDPDYQADPETAAAYAAQRKTLVDNGLLQKKNRLLGYLGTQMANAVWAVTEHTLPQVLQWLDDFQDAYHIRDEELTSLKQLAESGEFGLNAVVTFILGMTIRTPARIAAAPFMEDLEHTIWAAHPSRLPTMSDAVRMELREVFRPEYRPELVDDEPISEDFETLAAQMGYSKTQAENYWGAHWDLPSRTQGYTMYHRLRPAIQIDADGNVVPTGGKYSLPATYSNPFELADLNSLLKRQDVLKRYRAQLVQIAYKPFTRVDVRRMYRAGVLDFEEVIAAYLDAGYAPDKALKMAEFTKTWVTEGIEKRESKAGVLNAMKTGILSEAEAESELATFYPADLANRYVETAKIANKLNMSQVGRLFGIGEMDESEARDRFAEMGYPPEDIDYLITLYTP